MWGPRYRVLLVFFSVAICFGTREYLVVRSGGRGGRMGGCEASAASCFAIPAAISPTDDSTFWSRHSGVTNVLTQLNPDHPDAVVLEAMQSLQDGDTAASSRGLERALATGIKHNSFLLKSYAELLLNRGADWRLVNLAFNRWLANHPFSGDEISLQLAMGPRTQADAVVLEQSLEEVPWIADSRLEHSAFDGAELSFARFSVRRGHTIDLREAVAAVSVLSLTAEQRSLYEVTCRTLVNCTITRRAAR